MVHLQGKKTIFKTFSARILYFNHVNARHALVHHERTVHRTNDHDT